MSELLTGRWQETKSALLEGLKGTKKSVMESTLENTRKHLQESATAGATSAGNVATLNRVILPVIRRVMPTVIANEIVGVQPMTGPVGQIHTLRVRYSETNDNVTAGDEALSPFKIGTAYSGTGTDPAGVANATAALDLISAFTILVIVLRIVSSSVDMSTQFPIRLIPSELLSRLYQRYAQRTDLSFDRTIRRPALGAACRAGRFFAVR